MACHICSIPEQHIAIYMCSGCYDGAKGTVSFLNKLENDSKGGVIENQNISPVSQLNSSNKGIGSALRWMNKMTEREEGLNENLDFLGGLVVAFRDGIHSDIQVKPGNGPSIPAHRAILATRSVIFKNMLASDGCKAAPSDTISLPELDHDVLESLLEFLYAGNLAAKKIEEHVYSLSLAADKYEIPYLQKFCEHQMLKSLDSSNALDVLEISDVCSNTILKEAAMSFVLKHMGDIVFSTRRFEEFTRKNPHLSVEITRELFMELTSRGMRMTNLYIS